MRAVPKAAGGDRGAADGRHERGRRPVWRRKDVPAPGARAGANACGTIMTLISWIPIHASTPQRGIWLKSLVPTAVSAWPMTVVCRETVGRKLGARSALSCRSSSRRA